MKLNVVANRTTHPSSLYRGIAAILFAALFSLASMIMLASPPGKTSADVEKTMTRDNNGALKIHFVKSAMPDLFRVKDTGIAEARALLSSSDCYTCHADRKVLTAPSFSEIAAKYKNDKEAIPKLSTKVIAGSVGTWGDRPMPPHPEFLLEDVHKMVRYILNLSTAPVKKH